MNNSKSISLRWEDYCPSCENYDSSTGACSFIHQNVKDYPSKFLNKCGGKHYTGNRKHKPIMQNENNQKTIDATTADEKNKKSSNAFIWLITIVGYFLIILVFKEIDFIGLRYGNQYIGSITLAHVVILITLIIIIHRLFLYIFKRKDKNQNNNTPLLESDKISIKTNTKDLQENTVISNIKVQNFIDIAKSEGYNPYASIKVKCINCGIVYFLHKTMFGDKIDYNGTMLSIKDVDEKIISKELKCTNCSSTKLEADYNKITIKEWLLQICDELQPIQYNLSEGFQEVGGNRIIRDHTLKLAGDFETLWTQVKNYIEEMGFIAINEFNTIWSRSFMDHVNINFCKRIYHYNNNTNRLLTIIKDNSDQFWYGIEN